MPYLQSLAPGYYSVHVLDENAEKELDRTDCYLDQDSYCTAFYPPQPSDSIRANVLSRVYESAVTLGYSEASLDEIASRVALTYSQQGFDVSNNRDLQNLFSASPHLLKELRLYQTGKKTPFKHLLEEIEDKQVQSSLKQGLKSAAKGDYAVAVERLSKAADMVDRSKFLNTNEKQQLGSELKQTIESMQQNHISAERVQKIESTIRAIR
jgi:hypothetical protein